MTKRPLAACMPARARARSQKPVSPICDEWTTQERAQAHSAISDFGVRADVARIASRSRKKDPIFVQTQQAGGTGE
eukprot:6172943-Pleurochrysis_carterae.AAC.1